MIITFSIMSIGTSIFKSMKNIGQRRKGMVIRNPKGIDCPHVRYETSIESSIASVNSCIGTINPGPFLKERLIPIATASAREAILKYLNISGRNVAK
ncbi:hypothetical protein GCM10027454_39820 [Algoriphagus aestuariicola]